MVDSASSNSGRSSSRASLLLLLAIGVAGWAWYGGRVNVPDEWNPMTPLRIDAPLNALTDHKFTRASADPVECLAILQQAEMDWSPLDDRQTGAGCGLFSAVRIERTSVAVGEPFSMSCRAALSLAMWERHVLQQAAIANLGTKVKTIEHFGSYACRNLYGRSVGKRSQHATANALDIAGFVLEDGRRIRVLGDWFASNLPAEAAALASDAAAPAAGLAKASFLRQAQRGACRYFDAVLGPDYNQAHADHFHFDRGRSRVCR